MELSSRLQFYPEKLESKLEVSTEVYFVSNGLTEK